MYVGFIGDVFKRRCKRKQRYYIDNKLAFDKKRSKYQQDITITLETRRKIEIFKSLLTAAFIWWFISNASCSISALINKPTGWTGRLLVKYYTCDRRDLSCTESSRLAALMSKIERVFQTVATHLWAPVRYFTPTYIFLITFWSFYCTYRGLCWISLLKNSYSEERYALLFNKAENNLKGRQKRTKIVCLN